MQRNVWTKSLLMILSLAAVACAKSNSNNKAVATTPQANQFDVNGGPGAYNGAQLDPQTALNGMGQWVQIDDENYFVPDQSQLQDEDGGDWQPYQRGYWNYDDQKSWTWVSYEPFGWLTDHYGVWRHHSRHGWIWLPFRDRHYEPHTVTWFDDGNYVGWYPYFKDYSHGYRHGRSYGFDDGYWDGYQAVLSIQSPGFNLYLGFTMVNRSQFAEPNIRRVIVRDQNVIFATAYRAHGPDRIGRVGRYPGGHREGAFDFLQRYSTRRAPQGRVEVIRSRGGAEILQPHRTHPVPNDYRRRFENTRPGNQQPRRDENRRDQRREDSPGRFNPRNEERGRPTPPTTPPRPADQPRGQGNGRPEARPPMRPQVEQPRIETPRVTQPRIESPRTEQPRIETPRVTQPRVEPARTEPARTQERPRVDQPRSDSRRRDMIPVRRADESREENRFGDDEKRRRREQN